MIWNEKYECLPQPFLQSLQGERLQKRLREVYEKVPFYRQAMKERGVSPESVKSFADVARLPFTTKSDFRDNYPFGLLAVPLDQVVRLHASSGTTGKPIVAAYTQNDIGTWAEVMARALAAGGTTKDDIVQPLAAAGINVEYVYAFVDPTP